MNVTGGPETDTEATTPTQTPARHKSRGLLRKLFCRAQTDVQIVQTVPDAQRLQAPVHDHSEPWVLPQSLQPGFCLDEAGNPVWAISPICKQVASADLVETVAHGSRVRHPPWLTVSATNHYAGQYGDSTFGNWQNRYIAGRSELAASGGAAAVVPVKGKGAGSFSNSKTSAAADRSNYFDFVAAALRVDLDMTKVQCSPVFLQIALEELPDQLSDRPTAEELKTVDARIRRFLTLVGAERFVATTRLGGTATGSAQSTGRNSKKSSNVTAELQAQVDAAAASGGIINEGQYSSSAEQLTAKKFADLVVRGGNESLQEHGMGGLRDWLISLKMPHYGLEAINSDAYSEWELVPVHQFLEAALLNCQVVETEETSGSSQQSQQSVVAPVQWHQLARGVLTSAQKDKLLQQLKVLLRRWRAITAGMPVTATGSLQVAEPDNLQRPVDKKEIVFINTLELPVCVSLKSKRSMTSDMRADYGFFSISMSRADPDPVIEQAARLGRGQCLGMRLPSGSSATYASCAVVNEAEDVRPLCSNICVVPGKIYKVVDGTV